MLKVSIIMATYNGEKYIKEQLDSIVRQTRKPDEVLIVDDCSTDNTYDIIKDYVECHNLFGWKVYRNEHNKGWKKNFYDSFFKVSGDVVFCADQDDIWFAEKIEKMCKIMEQNEYINVLACNLIPKYEDGSIRIASKYEKPYHNNYLEQVVFNRKSFDVPRPGCTLCFRKSMVPIIQELWYEELAHDAALWMIGIITESAYILNEPLIYFRRHSNNSSPSNKKTSAVRSEIIKRNKDKATVMLKHSELIGLNDENISDLKKIENFYMKRYMAVKGKNPIKALSLIVYLSHYDSFKVWVSDVIASLR